MITKGKDEKFEFTALWLSAICIAVFVIQQIGLTEYLLLDKSKQFYWTYLTSIFAHANIAHLGGNLFGLALFGSILEHRIGRKRLLILFLVTGLLVNILSTAPRSLGASGAIFGIFGALSFLRPRLVVWVYGFPMPLAVAGIVWLVYNILGNFVPSNVGYLAHITGLLIGFIFGMFWRKRFGDVYKKSKKDKFLDKRLDIWENIYMRKR